MTMMKDEPRSTVEGGCDVAGGDGGAAAIGGNGTEHGVFDGSVEKSIHEVRSTENTSSEADASTVLPNQLTIFFGGSVTVFDGLPAEKVQEIIRIAAKAMETKNSTSTSPVPSPALNRAPSFSSTSNVASPAAQSFSIQPISFCRSAAGQYSIQLVVIIFKHL
ncbi:hypothetical protein CARUB_v10002004mg [Capsella rubella]|uniref:Protein TIFY n=1 Tax=Capsella rubella TaxID=81985 RepID=R0FH01_9BRAS|nr:hypothetical protein CARUB_v10002004mg [Capsella rubella]